ncbi:MAG: phosphatase PAP2 family protein [Rhodoferax sp.]|nr:phosphatase PAP2 family protein [Rhodoferax sp.]
MNVVSRLIAFFVPSLSACLMAAPAWAWGPEGHQSVGAVADRLLAGSSAAQIARDILGGTSLQNASLWADCAKGVVSADGATFLYSVAVNSDGSRRFPECAQFENPEEEARQVAFVSRNWKQCGTAHGREMCHNQYHYADISDLRDHYAENMQGTQPHDIVHSINAAIAVLRGQQAPSPFDIRARREALLLLSHYVGDIHQPLHVKAAYLDAAGQTVDPDAAGHIDPKTDTAGGNQIFDGARRLHSEWDGTPQTLNVGAVNFGSLVDKARAVTASAGDPVTWSAQWATDTIQVGKPAFENLSFKLKSGGATPEWNVVGVDSAYNERADSLKAEQLAKAGARLAQILKTIWPEGSSPPPPAAPTACSPLPEHTPPAGYLSPALLPDIATWLPAAPSSGSAAQAADNEAIRDAGRALSGARGMQAALDDVFLPGEVALRFKAALGVELNHCNAPRLMILIERAQTDATTLVAPVKRTVAEGGRKRPFVASPKLHSCISPVDMAGKRHNDLDVFHLDKTGSYPSTHALLGEFVGMVLTSMAPDRATALTAWGLSFGDSRMICRFHYPSDVAAGRLAASALWARLLADPAFKSDLMAATIEVRDARDR